MSACIQLVFINTLCSTADYQWDLVAMTQSASVCAAESAEEIVNCVLCKDSSLQS